MQRKCKLVYWSENSLEQEYFSVSTENPTFSFCFPTDGQLAQYYLESWTPPVPTCGICNLKISCILVHISTHLLLPPPKVASIFLFFFLSQKILAKTLRSHREKMGLFIAVTHIFSWRAHLTEEKGQLLCGSRFKSDTGCIKQRAATVRQGCSL